MKRKIQILIALVYGIFQLFAQDKAAEINKLMQTYDDYGSLMEQCWLLKVGK